MHRRTRYGLTALTAALLLWPGAANANWLENAVKSKVKTYDGSQAGKDDTSGRDRRGKVVIRRIKPQCKSDWNVDPTALPYLTYQLQVRTDGKFPCYVDNTGISLLGDEIFDYPIIYFTSHFAFTFTDEEVENLKKFLARGGTLWLDDCSGSGPFMDSTPSNVQRVIPGADMTLVLPEQEEFAEFFKIMYELKGYPALKEQFAKPFQIAFLDGRPAIIFCPNDYGCSWEVASPPTALNPLGNPAHASGTPTTQTLREEVYQISLNWLFYTLTH